MQYQSRIKGELWCYASAFVGLAMLLGCYISAWGAQVPHHISSQPYGTLLYENASGYALVALVSFTVAVVFTTSCMRYSERRNKQKKEEER